MKLDNHYTSRYRSIPAASSCDAVSMEQAPYLIKNTELPDTYITLMLHYHPEIEILVVKDGVWQYKAGYGEGYSLANSGDILFFMPYEPHEAFVSSLYPQYRTQCICFDAALLGSPASQKGDMLARQLLGNQKTITRIIPAAVPENKFIAEQFDRMMDALKSDGADNLFAFLGGLFTMFGILDEYRHIHPSPKEDGENHAETAFARQAIEFIENNYNKKTSTSDIAAKLNYNESYFCRTFRKVFHMRYNDYLQRYRITKTCSLLNQMSVSDAAYSCGFTHMGSFSAYFKRYTGMTPTEYRDLHRSDE